VTFRISNMPYSDVWIQIGDGNSKDDRYQPSGRASKATRKREARENENVHCSRQCFQLGFSRL
jgi:hypothetical protein